MKRTRFHTLIIAPLVAGTMAGSPGDPDTRNASAQERSRAAESATTHEDRNRAICETTVAAAERVLPEAEIVGRLVNTLVISPLVRENNGGLRGRPGPADASPHDGCDLPGRIAVGAPGDQVVFELAERCDDGRLLDELDSMTLIKWGAGLILPGLARAEIAIYLHDSRAADFLADYDDIDTFRGVRFYLACREGSRYRVARATARRAEIGNTVDDWTDQDRALRYVGLTIPVTGRQPDAILRGTISP